MENKVTSAVKPDGAPLSRHTFLENVQGQAIALILTAFGLSLLRAAGLTTGQTAGVALIVSMKTGWSFGLVYFAVNLPFYIFAVVRMGWVFALRSLAFVGLLSALIDAAPRFFVYEKLDNFAAAVVAGICAGFGVLGLFRHGVASGGFGLMAYYVQEKTGFRAGWLQLAFDGLIFAVASLCLPFAVVVPSLLGAVILNLIIAFNHRPDWYIAR